MQFVIGAQTVKAHKFVLMARCEVLGNMVSGPMTGMPSSIQPAKDQAQQSSAKNITSITIGNQVSFRSFQLLLEYIYTDDICDLLYIIQEDLSVGLDLICMADQYMIQRLKYISEESIISANQINLQNVCFLLNFSTI